MILKTPGSKILKIDIFSTGVHCGPVGGQLPTMLLRHWAETYAFPLVEKFGVERPAKVGLYIGARCHYPLLPPACHPVRAHKETVLLSIYVPNHRGKSVPEDSMKRVFFPSSSPK